MSPSSSRTVTGVPSTPRTAAEEEVAPVACTRRASSPDVAGADPAGGGPAAAPDRRAGVAEIRVFRRQAVERYVRPASSPAAPPAHRPRAFAALWLLFAALVTAGLLIVGVLAGDLGYLRADPPPGATGPAATAGAGAPAEPGGAGG